MNKGDMVTTNVMQYQKYRLGIMIIRLSLDSMSGILYTDKRIQETILWLLIRFH